MATWNRRDWLKAALMTGPLLAPGAARAIGPIGRTRPSHLKLSLAAYSFRDQLQPKTGKPTMDLFDFVDLAADNALDGVELTSYYFPPDVTPAYLHKLKQHAFTLGLDVSGTSTRNDFCLPPGPARDADIQRVKTGIDHAAELDAPVIRIFAGTVPKGDSEDAAAERVIAGIKAVLPHAIERGVTLGLENHGGITATPQQLLRLVHGVDSPNFGVNLDTANFRGPDPYGEFAEVAPYAVNVQVKTEIQRNGGPKEPADLAQFITSLRHAHYSGYVVLEYEAKEDPHKAVPPALRTLRSLIG